MPRTIRQTVEDERPWQGGTRIRLHFQAAGEAIPAVLLLPSGPGPHPGVLLLHGFTSRKEHMAEGVGAGLLRHGMASLAVDLPLHGSRADPLQARSARSPLAAMRLWKQALGESALGLRYLSARAEVDGARLALAGYSMGSYLATMLAAREPSVRALVLAAGGDLPAGTPLAAVARAVADPLRAVRALNGRPLLMVHGRGDRTVKPDQAQRLFDAAGEPKELRWYPGGHILPPAVVEDVGAWLARRLGAEGVRSAPG